MLRLVAVTEQLAAKYIWLYKVSMISLLNSMQLAVFSEVIVAKGGRAEVTSQSFQCRPSSRSLFVFA